MNTLLAQAPDSMKLGNIGGNAGTGLGPFSGAFSGDATSIAGNVSSLISVVIGVITIAGGLYFLAQFIIGAIHWIGASGDKNKLQQAQDRITHAFIGLVIVIAAYAIVSIISTVFGLDILTPENVIPNLLLGGKPATP